MELNTSSATEPTPAQAAIAKRFEQATRAAVGYLDTLQGPVAGLQRLPVARAMIEAGLSVLDLGKSARIAELEGHLAIARKVAQAACEQADEDALRTLPPTLPRKLLGLIVDEVFDGAVEDTTVIEDIYKVIARAGVAQGSAA